MDSMTVTVALFALCGANLAMIWQLLRLTDRVDDVQKDMHATARWLARMEAHRLSVAGKKDGGNDDNEH